MAKYENSKLLIAITIIRLFDKHIDMLTLATRNKVKYHCVFFRHEPVAVWCSCPEADILSPV